MKNLSIRLVCGIAILSSSIAFFSSCEEEKNWETTVYEVGDFDAISDNTSILAGETITFTDLSTKVYSREWSFLGGDPASSGDSTVTVSYNQGSKVDAPYVATLTVTYLDNRVETREFNIEVEGEVLATYAIFTEDATKDFGTNTVLEPNNAYSIETITGDAFEGEKSIYFKFDGTDNWGVMASIKPDGGSVDISDFADGTYNVSIKTSCVDTMLIRVHSDYGDQKAIVTLDPVTESYGLKREGSWHSLSIPMADFLKDNPSLDLTNITDLLVFRSGTPTVSADEDWDFYVDNFYLQEAADTE